MSLTLRQRLGVELLLFTLARALEALDIVRAALDQARAYAVHIRHGGDPAEHRRNLWLTREQIKAQYRRGGSETRPKGK